MHGHVELTNYLFAKADRLRRRDLDVDPSQARPRFIQAAAALAAASSHDDVVRSVIALARSECAVEQAQDRIDQFNSKRCLRRNKADFETGQKLQGEIHAAYIAFDEAWTAQCTAKAAVGKFLGSPIDYQPLQLLVELCRHWADSQQFEDEADKAAFLPDEFYHRWNDAEAQLTATENAFCRAVFRERELSGR